MQFWKSNIRLKIYIFRKEQTRGDAGAQSHGSATVRMAGPPKEYLDHRTPIFGMKIGVLLYSDELKSDKI